MTRPLRIQYPGAFYHITSRGNERKAIFKSIKDREKFLSYLETATERYNARIISYCLMDNHYHLFLKTPEGNLSQIMRHINGAYTTYFNTKRQRSGHLFQGRYKAILVEADEYATELTRYIHLNPVRAGVVEDPAVYPWSSFKYYIGLKKSPEWLVVNFILDAFGRTYSTAYKAYRDFVNALVKQEYESPLKEVFASTILGSLDFINYIQKNYLDSDKNNRDIPALTKLAKKRAIEEIKEAVGVVIEDDPALVKKVALYISHRFSGRKLKEIGDSFKIGESAVSQNSRRLEGILAKDKKLQKQISIINRNLGLSNM
jgi:REP element-mobilizing transposase RayT